DGKFTKVDRDGALRALHEDLQRALSDDEVERCRLSQSLLPHVRAFYANYLDPDQHGRFIGRARGSKFISRASSGGCMREVIPAPVPGLDLCREYGHHQSPAIRAGGMVFCSGMVAIDPQSGERQHGTVTSEARRIFENLKLLLESADSSLDRIAQV